MRSEAMVEKAMPYEGYLTVELDAGVEAFLEVVGGDRATFTGPGTHTLVARGDTDGSGNQSVAWGVTDIGTAPASAGVVEIQDYADRAAAEADGWTFTNTASPSTGNIFTFNDPEDVGPYPTSFKMTSHNNGYGVQIGTGYLQAEKTFTVVNGQSYQVKVWAGSHTGNAWYATAVIVVISGATSHSADINGTEADQILAPAAITASGTSLTVRLKIKSEGVFAPNQPWRFAHLTVDGLSGGGAVATFRDIPSCVGTGFGQAGGLEPEPLRRAA
jgi:hypothetical protein